MGIIIIVRKTCSSITLCNEGLFYSCHYYVSNLEYVETSLCHSKLVLLGCLVVELQQPYAWLTLTTRRQLTRFIQLPSPTVTSWSMHQISIKFLNVCEWWHATISWPIYFYQDFEETRELVEEYKFPSLFINQFFPRPGTPAAKMNRVVPTQDVSRLGDPLWGLWHLEMYLIQSVHIHGV